MIAVKIRLEWACCGWDFVGGIWLRTTRRNDQWVVSWLWQGLFFLCNVCMTACEFSINRYTQCQHISHLFLTRVGNASRSWQMEAERRTESGWESIIRESSAAIITYPYYTLQGNCAKHKYLIYFRINSPMFCRSCFVTLRKQRDGAVEKLRWPTDLTCPRKR